MMTGESPKREYQVRPVRNSMSAISKRRSLTFERCETFPLGEINAEKPVGATCTTARPNSIARNCDYAIC